jgi:hypothetical protein
MPSSRKRKYSKKRAKAKLRKKPRRPDSYVSLPGCHSCKHCFRRYEYEEPDEYYCTTGASRRPRCGSVAMKESGTLRLTDGALKKSRELLAKWARWAEGRDVKPWGYCQKYVPDAASAALNSSSAAKALEFPFQTMNETLVSSRTTSVVVDVDQSVRSKKD